MSTEKATFEVGPIWNNAEAAQKANAWINRNRPGEGWKFTGEWNTTVPGKMSVAVFTRPTVQVGSVTSNAYIVFIGGCTPLVLISVFVLRDMKKIFCQC